MLGTAIQVVGQPSFPPPPFNFWGMYQSGRFFEPTIAVGPQRIIQVGNHKLACYDTTVSQDANENAPLWKAHLNASIAPDNAYGPYFWNDPDGCFDVDPTSNLNTVDPRVLYDPFTQRFIVAHIQAIPGRLLLAISKNSTPNGPGCDDWHKFLITTDTTNTSGFHFIGLASSQQAIYVTAQYNNTTTGERGSEIQTLRPLPAEPWTHDSSYYAMLGVNRVQRKILLRSNPNDPPIDPVNTQVALVMPAQFYDTAANTMYFLQIVDQGLANPPTSARLRLSAVTDPFGANQLQQAADFSVTAINGGSAAQVQQQCPSDTVFTGPFGISNVVFQSGKLYFAYIAQVVGAYPGRFVVRWHILNTNGWPVSGTPALEQNGVIDGGRIFYSPNPGDDRPVHYMFPYIMPTAAGDVALFLTRLNSKEHVSCYWTGRRAGDSAHTMGAPLQLMKAGTSGVELPKFFGEYLGIARDPGNSNTVWAVGEVGRCVPLLGLGPCTTCATGITYQNYFHTIIGSHQVPSTATHPVRTLTVQRQAVNPPPDPIDVWIMPPDTGALADVVLNSGTGVTRSYGHGTSVTLRVKLTVGDHTFSHWLVNGLQISPPPPDPVQLTVLMLGNRTVTPIYDGP